MRPFNLTLRITLIVSVTILIIISGSGLYLYNQLTALTKDHLIEETEINVLAVSKDISNIFENASLATDYLSLQQHIRDYLKDVDTRAKIKSHDRLDEVINTLLKVKLMNSYHYYTWIGNEAVSFYIDHNGYYTDENYDVGKRPWYHDAMAADGISISDPYVEVSSFNTVISFIKILYESEQAYGFVAVDIVLKDMPGIIEQMKISDNDKVYLVAEDGSLISNSINVVNQFENLYEDTWFNDYYDHINIADGSYKVVEKEGVDYMLSSHKINTSNWKLITLTDYQIINRDLTSVTWPIILVFLIGLSVSIIAVYLFTHITVVPFKNLVFYGQSIAAGQYDKNVPEAYRKRSDEMGGLSNAFQMIIDVYRSIGDNLEDQIREKNQALEDRYRVLIEQEKQASLGLILSGVAETLEAPVKESLKHTDHICQTSKEMNKSFDQGLLKKSELKGYMKNSDLLLDDLVGQLKKCTDVIETFKLISTQSNLEEKHMFSIKEILDIAYLSFKGKLDLDHHKFIVSCNDTYMINSYPVSLLQVLSQLIMNSIEHGFVDEYCVIQIEVYQKEETYQILYKDNGIGMTQDKIDLVNKPGEFKSLKDGFGIQAIYNTVCHKMSGDVNFQSKANEGLTCLIVLPR